MASPIVSARLKTFWRRLGDYWRLWQLQHNGFVPALATTSHCPVSNQTSTHESVLDSFFSPLLMAVPRNRRTVEKRRMRRFANTWFDQTKLKKNIIVCLNCGHHHESDTICGNCYSKVREETEAMRAAMGDDEYNYNHPRTEVAYIYNDDDRQSPMYKGRKIVEMKKKRPEWFSPHLKTKV